MRHHNNIRKFGRERKARRALLKSLAFALMKKEKIKTTEAKAKELRPYIEKIITLAKKNTSAAKRLLASRFSAEVLPKLFNKLGPKYKDRKGGYTRIVKISRRKSDGAKMAVIAFVE